MRYSILLTLLFAAMVATARGRQQGQESTAHTEGPLSGRWILTADARP